MVTWKEDPWSTVQTTEVRPEIGIPRAASLIGQKQIFLSVRLAATEISSILQRFHLSLSEPAFAKLQHLTSKLEALGLEFDRWF